MSFAAGHIVLQVGFVPCVVLLFTWLMMKSTSLLIDLLRNEMPRYSVRGLLMYVTVAAVVIALLSALFKHDV